MNNTTQLLQAALQQSQALTTTLSNAITATAIGQQGFILQYSNGSNPFAVRGFNHNRNTPTASSPTVALNIYYQAISPTHSDANTWVYEVTKLTLDSLKQVVPHLNDMVVESQHINNYVELTKYIESVNDPVGFMYYFDCSLPLDKSLEEVFVKDGINPRALIAILHTALGIGIPHHQFFQLFLTSATKVIGDKKEKEESMNERKCGVSLVVALAKTIKNGLEGYIYHDELDAIIRLSGFPFTATEIEGIRSLTYKRDGYNQMCGATKEILEELMNSVHAVLGKDTSTVDVDDFMRHAFDWINIFKEYLDNADGYGMVKIIISCLNDHLGDSEEDTLKRAEGMANATVYTLRDAIQEAERFSMVRTEDGTVITGAVWTKDGIVLVKE